MEDGIFKGLKVLDCASFSAAPAAATVLSGSRKATPRRPPGVGEHSDEVLREAGYDKAAIQQLRAAGAVG